MSKNRSEKSVTAASSAPTKTRSRGTSTAIEWIKSIAIAIGIAMLIRWPVAEPFKIPSGSMKPTLLIGDRIFVNKHAYGVRFPFNGFRIPLTRTTIWYTHKWLWNGPTPHRWDIVVFKSVEPNAEHDTLVKRVVGLPGEHVLIRGGHIYINGKMVETPPSMPKEMYTQAPRSNGYGLIDDDEHSLVPPGHVFLLGDNSEYSRDARWFGFVPKRNLLGRVTCIWWPPSQWRDFSGFTRSWWWIGGWTLLGVYLFLRLFVGRSVKVYSEGLADVLERGEHVFIRFGLGVPIPFTTARVGSGRGPQRGEVVLYKPPKDSGAPDLLLGIVAGLPDEKVQLQDGQLQINGNALEGQGALSEPRFTANGQGGKYGLSRGKEYSQVPSGHYFLLTNGRGAAPDSRLLGWIPRDRIVGPARLVWWPIGRWRRVGADAAKPR